LNAREYYVGIQSAIHAAPHVLSSDLSFEEIDTNECYLRGVLMLIGNLELHVAEYTVTEPVVRREKYRYHLQTTDAKLISRWDNVAHHPAISTFPNHRHDDQGNIQASPTMGIREVLDAVLPFIPSS
jgi:hypothetical protein